jgi:hypothetical protein
MSIPKVHSVNSDQIWLQQREMEIQKHPAWCGLITAQEAEELLFGKLPLTYLLRSTEKPDCFFLSFIPQNGPCYHQIFHIEHSFGRWLYRNGDLHHAETLEDLVPLVMHCTKSEIIPFQKQL